MSASVSDVDLPDEAVLGGQSCTHYSSVELDACGIAEKVRKAKRQGPHRLVTVGSLAQLYKGTDVLIEAVAQCVRAGLDVSALIVGDGKYHSRLTSLADRLGVGSRIEFAGQVTAGNPVRQLLDTSDLFVLPSRTEGLPRALIEAMARALPCIGSSVGGIPELLGPDELVAPGDVHGLAVKIQEVLRDPGRMEALSRRNLETSMQYRDSILAERRRRFYTHVRDYMNDWEARQANRQ
jgi:glycosyltransferase involved in cell wall biosynthesis